MITLLLFQLGACAVLTLVEILRFKDQLCFKPWLVVGMCLLFPVSLPLLISILAIGQREIEREQQAEGEEGFEKDDPLA